jgi:hypothetical protein
MTHASGMLQDYPADLGGLDRAVLARAIQAAVDCAQACTACANACLSEPDVGELIRCIRSNLDCTDVCESTARVLSRCSGPDADLTPAVLEVCIRACRACANECNQHAAHHAHCRRCAEACARCGEACEELSTSMG